MYNAFISYSHAADGKLAPALQAGLQKFAKPWYKLRNLNVFRDEASLSASPHLWSNIQKALSESEYLIYMASPVSASSHWVTKEIEYWIENKPIEKLLIVLTDGEITWDNESKSLINTDSNSLPQLLEEKFTEEPFYIDLRLVRTEKDLSLNNPIFKKEVLKLAAQLHGKEPKDLASEEVTAHRKMIKARNIAIGLLGFLFIAAVAGAIIAYSNAKIAIKERDIAQARYLISEAKSEVENDPTIALRLAELAMQKHNDAVIEAAAYKIYRENFFYKIITTTNSRINAVAFSPDSKHILAGLDDSTARLLDLQGKEVTKFRGHTDVITSVAFSPDGETVLTSGANTVRLWDLKGKLIRLFEGKDEINSAAFSPDGKYIGTSSSFGNVRLWNIDGSIFKELQSEAELPCTVNFSPDGKYIVSAKVGFDARIWDMDGNVFRDLIGHDGRVISVAFSPNGREIVTAAGERDQTARIWDLEGNTKFELRGHKDYVATVSFSPDGKYILTGSGDHTVRIWNWNGKTYRALKGHTGGVNSAVFSADGKYILTGSDDNTIRLWYLKGNEIRDFDMDEPVLSVAFSPDGKYILAGSSKLTPTYKPGAKGMIENSGAALWNKSGKKIKELRGHTSDVCSVIFSPDEKSMLTGSSDKTARLWDMNGTSIQTFSGHHGEVHAVAFSPDGKNILTGCDDHTVRLWDLKGTIIREFTGHLNHVRSVQFSPDGKYILTGSADSTARLWDTNGKLIHTFGGHLGEIRSVAFSPDNKLLLTGSADSTIILWDLQGNKINTFKEIPGSVNAVAFSRDGKYILAGLAGDYNSELRLWDIKGNLIFQSQEGMDNLASSVAFSPDGNFFIGGFISPRWSLGVVQLRNIAIPLEDFLKSDKIEALSAEQRTKLEIK